VVSVGHLVRDVIDDQFALSSALPRTLRVLFTRPGTLTNEYLAGRIARYIPPFRLYLVASIVFFLCLSILTTVRPPASQNVATIEVTGSPVGRPIDVRVRDGSMFGIQTDTLTSADSTIVWINIGTRALSEKIATRVREMSHLQEDEIARSIVSAALERSPAAMFVLLPVFALLLHLVHLGRGRFYVEHFVFALHTHAFTFLVLAVGVPFPSRIAEPLFFLWIAVYCFLAMRTVYGGGIAATALRFVFLSVAYSFLLSAALLGAIAVGLLFG
jgi:hypothetical protein